MVRIFPHKLAQNKGAVSRARLKHHFPSTDSPFRIEEVTIEKTYSLSHRPPSTARPHPQQALRVLETRLKKMAGNDGKGNSLKVGGKDQEVDLEASTAKV